MPALSDENVEGPCRGSRVHGLEPDAAARKCKYELARRYYVFPTGTQDYYLGGRLQQCVKVVRGERFDRFLLPVVDDTGRRLGKRVRPALVAETVLAIGVIDLIATDIPDLLERLDGRAVVVKEEPVRLFTTGATTRDVEMTFVEGVLSGKATSG